MIFCILGFFQQRASHCRRYGARHARSWKFSLQHCLSSRFAQGAPLAGPHSKTKGVRLQDAFSYPHPRGTPRLREAFAGYLESTFLKARSACRELFGRGNSKTRSTELRLRRGWPSTLST